MRVTKVEWRSILVPVFVAAQLVLVHAAASGEYLPPPPPAVGFPVVFGAWRLFSQDPLDGGTARELGADRVESQTYFKPATGAMVSSLVAWFRTQRDGTRQPHSPKVCLPGAGWTPIVAGEITFDTSAGSITVNRYIVDRDGRHAVVLYWYQAPRRVIDGEWAAKFWVAADALRDHRTDMALVRVIAWPGAGGDRAAQAAAVGFASRLYPALREYLPH